MGSPDPPPLGNQEWPMQMENAALHLGGFPLFSMVIIFICRPYMNIFKIIHFFPLIQVSEISIFPMNFEISDTKTKTFILVQWTFYIAHWLFFRAAYMLIKKPFYTECILQMKRIKINFIFRILSCSFENFSASLRVRKMEIESSIPER